MERKSVSRNAFPWVGLMLDRAKRNQPVTVCWDHGDRANDEVIRFGKKEQRFLTVLSHSGVTYQIWESFRNICINEEVASAKAAEMILIAIKILIGHGGRLILARESTKRLERIQALAEKLRYELLRDVRFCGERASEFLRIDDCDRVIEEFLRSAQSERIRDRYPVSDKQIRETLQRVMAVLEMFPLTMPELLNRVADQAADDARLRKMSKAVNPHRKDAKLVQFREYIGEMLLIQFPKASLLQLARITNTITIAAYPTASDGEKAIMRYLGRLRKKHTRLMKKRADLLDVLKAKDKNVWRVYSADASNARTQVQKEK
jgi:hypothetical protein